MMSRDARCFVILVAAVFAAYFNAFWGSFQFDDFNVIVGDPAVQSFSAWFADLRHGLRPLLKFSYLLNWTSGAGLFGFHLFNISVHAANAFLIFLLSAAFFEKEAALRSPVHERAAFLTALLFALHPVQTEAVTYICGRSMSLMTLLYLISLLAYVRGSEAGRTWLLYILSPLLFLAAVCVKETAITLPFALVLWEAGTGSAKDWKRLVRKQAAHWGMLACFALYILFHSYYFDLLFYGFEKRGFVSNLLSQVHGASYLLSRLVFMHRLNIDPDLPLFASWDPLAIAEAMFLAALLAIGIMHVRKRPWLGFGLLWFFLHILPTNSIIPRLDIANERHLYLAGWGLYLAAAGEIVRLVGTEKQVTFSTKVLAASFFAILVLFTVMRNHVYRNEISLWQDTVLKTPFNARAHNNLGYAYFHAGREQDALAEYREAIRLRPGYERAEKNLAAMMNTLNRKPSMLERERP